MTTKIHVLIISSWYPSKEKPFLGNFVQRQAKLISEKYKVTVINTISNQNFSEELIEKKSDVNFTEITITHPKSNSLFQKRKEQRNAFKKGLELVEDVDIVLGSIALPKAWQFILAKKKFDCSLLYIEQGSYFRPEKKKQWSIIDKLLIRSLKRNVDLVIPVSEFLKKDMLDVFKGCEFKVIGNHVDTELFSSSKKKSEEITSFLHISTLDSNTKNPEGIIDACELLSKARKKFKLTIVCDESLSKWKKIVAKKKIENFIEFVGPLKWEETVAFYNNADAFILFSYYETFSVVLAEAWLTGTPTISTSVGIADQLPENIGQIVEQRDVTELKNSMIKVIDKSVQFNEDEIRSFAMQFSGQNILNKWSSVIDYHVR